jgi:hypothetical protein
MQRHGVDRLAKSEPEKVAAFRAGVLRALGQSAADRRDHHVALTLHGETDFLEVALVAAVLEIVSDAGLARSS